MTASNHEPQVEPLESLRILVVEDEMMIAMLMEDFLEEFGCTIVGPVANIEKALLLIKTETIDGALLDLNLGGNAAYPVADELTRRRIPFIVVSGYGDEELSGGYNGRPRLPKPFRRTDLQYIMTTTFTIGLERK